jgi:sRNA-binding protein
MSYRYNRQEIESAIELLAELYPKCFFLDPEKRRPLKNNIVADLTKDGVTLAHELVRASIDWYQSHFGYQLALEAGARRIDLHGNENGTVTETEERNARKYVHDRKQEERERKQEERERRNAHLIVEAKRPTAEFNLPLSKLPSLSVNNMKEMPMPKAVKPDNPLAPIESLLDGVRHAYELPEPLHRPLVVAGLRVVISEIEKTITAMESNNEYVPPRGNE